MTRRRIEPDAQSPGAAAPRPASQERPRDVERFRAMVGTAQAHAETGATRVDDVPVPTLPQAPQAADLALAHQTDFDAARARPPRPDADRREAHPTPCAHGEKATGADAHPAPNGHTAGRRTVRDAGPGRPRRRPGLRTHDEREQALQSIVELLEAAQRRAPPTGLSELTIVPPSPNPLRLSLSLSMQGDDFVVKATTELGAEHRDHVLQSLNALEHALSQRLREPVRARVMLAA